MFVELEPGASALVKIGRKSGQSSDIARMVKVGDAVEVRILAVDGEKRQVLW